MRGSARRPALDNADAAPVSDHGNWSSGLITLKMCRGHRKPASGRSHVFTAGAGPALEPPVARLVGLPGSRSHSHCCESGSQS